MKKIILACYVVAFALSSCTDNYNDVEVQKAPKVHTLVEDLEIAKKFMRIDTINYSYAVTITDSAIQAENISENNLIQILSNIDELNKKVKESIQKGEITTLLLATKKEFKSFTIGNIDNLSFTDTRVPIGRVAATRGYPMMTFSNGNWGLPNSEFEASDKVTSFFAVDYANGYWQASFTCSTGTSSYGNTFSTYGTGITYGKINRYWWNTVGGSAPYWWEFSANGPVGGDASGSVAFGNT